MLIESYDGEDAFLHAATPLCQLCHASARGLHVVGTKVITSRPGYEADRRHIWERSRLHHLVVGQQNPDLQFEIILGGHIGYGYPCLPFLVEFESLG